MSYTLVISILLSVQKRHRSSITIFHSHHLKTSRYLHYLHAHTFTLPINIKWKFNSLVWKWACREEHKCGLRNINQHNMINGFSEVLCWQNYCLSNSSASTRVKFPDGADVLPSIIDHFIQLISCWFWTHLKCQTVMSSMCHWKCDNTLFSELRIHHLNGIPLEKKAPQTVPCFLCYPSPNWFRNSKSLRWQADLLFSFELPQRHSHPVIRCCVMKRFPCWRLLCFFFL